MRSIKLICLPPTMVLKHLMFSSELASWDCNVQKTRTLLEWVLFWITWRQWEQCDDSTERTSSTSYSALLPGMAWMLKWADKVRILVPGSCPHSLQVYRNIIYFTESVWFFSRPRVWRSVNLSPPTQFFIIIGRPDTDYNDLLHT
jgi:hypothetical protein